jgi:hypothetical protein
MKESDSLQAKESIRGECIGIVPRKHKPKEGETKWFEVERAPGSFQGGEEKVEGGKYKNIVATTYQC